MRLAIARSIKSSSGVASKTSSNAALVVCCRPPSPRGLDPQLVAKAAADLGVPIDRVEVVETVAEAVGTAQLSTPIEGQIVITGSLYVVGAARALLVR